MKFTFSTCEEAQVLLPLLRSSELDREEASGLQQHLAACERCQKEARVQRQYDDVLRQACLEDAPHSALLQQRVRNRIRAAATPSWRHRFAIHMPRVLASALAGAFAMLLVLFGGLWYFVRSAQITLPAASARDHVRCVLNHEHEDWHTQPKDVAAFFEQHLGTGHPVNYQALGLNLVRTRICNLGGPRFVHMVLVDDRQREISLYVRQSATRLLDGSARDAAGKPALHYDHAGSFEFASFESGNKTVLLLTSLTAEGTERLADRLLSQFS